MAYYMTCGVCGAHLDPGERCDCGKPIPKARAICPYFRQRLDVGGQSSIECVKDLINISRSFETKALRDEEYLDLCCDANTSCGVFDAINETAAALAALNK